MKNKKKLITFTVLLTCTLLFCALPVFAAELTEAEVEQAVASQGKEAVTGNVFVWFLCAIAFLKVSQKIDSFMSSLGINVGNIGGNMMAELLIAGRGISSTFRSHGGGGGYRKAASPGSAAVGGDFLSGGLAGSVGRQAERSAVNAATGYSEGSGIGNSLYLSSLKKGGDFANNVISNIAKGNYGQVGSIKGEDASNAFTSYMGLNSEDNPASPNIELNSDGTPTNNGLNSGVPVSPDNGPNSSGIPASPDASEQMNTPIPSYNNIEIGGGRITGTESTKDGDREFAMYHADQYMAPPQGDYETVQSVDGAAWYKQYAQDKVEKKPYETANGKIAYHESIVQKLPSAPPRKDRI